MFGHFTILWMKGSIVSFNMISKCRGNGMKTAIAKKCQMLCLFFISFLVSSKKFWLPSLIFWFSPKIVMFGLLLKFHLWFPLKTSFLISAWNFNFILRLERFNFDFRLKVSCVICYKSLIVVFLIKFCFSFFLKMLFWFPS